MLLLLIKSFNIFFVIFAKKDGEQSIIGQDFNLFAYKAYKILLIVFCSNSRQNSCKR